MTDDLFDSRYIDRHQRRVAQMERALIEQNKRDAIHRRSRNWQARADAMRDSALAMAEAGQATGDGRR